MKGKYQYMIAILQSILDEKQVEYYSHPKSKHTFTIHQHIILLALRQYESKSYESFVEWLEVSPVIIETLNLSRIPHYTTLQKAAARIDEELLYEIIASFIKRTTSEEILAAADATGFETGHATPYYTYRCSLRHAYTKMTAGSDMDSQLICAVAIAHHPIPHDVKQFPDVFSQMLKTIPMHTILLDKGYDSEQIHEMIRAENILSIIPTRKHSDYVSRIQGRYRKEMKREFDKTTYGQRSKTESIFSVIKGRFGSWVRAHLEHMMTKELLFRVVAYNLHRMSILFLAFFMISR